MAAVGYASGDPAKVDVAGDTMTGALVLDDGSPAASEDYVAGHAGSGAVASVFGRTGTVTAQAGDYTAVQVGADASGAATTAVTGHAGAVDPHGDRAYADTGDALKLAKASNLSDLGNAGTARTNLGLGTAATKNTGTTAGTVAAGDDSRLSDARTPTAHASTHNTGGTDALTAAGIGAAATSHSHAGTDITSGTVAYARLPVGTSTSTVVAGDDSRMTNARTPTAHASTHASGGSDPVTPAAIGALALSGGAVTGDLTVAGTAGLGGKNSLGNINFCGKRSAVGPPTTGTWALGDFVIDSNGALWLCTVAGTPGTWLPTYIDVEDGYTYKIVRTTFAGAGTDLFHFEVNGNRTGYANERGELRSRAYDATSVAFRCQSNVAGDSTSVHIIEATLSNNTVMFYVTALGDAATTRDLAVGRNLAVTGTASAAGVTSTAGITNSGGAIAAGTQKVTGVVDPTSAQEAATKNYVDTGAYSTLTDVASLGTNVAHGTPHIQSRTEPGGVVRLQGQLSFTGSITGSSTPGAGAVMMTLPAGQRPAAMVAFTKRFLGTGAAAGEWFIDTSGNLTSTVSLVSGNTVNLDGITFVHA